MQILMGMGEHRKASYIGLSLAEQFPAKAGVLLCTVECLIGCQDFAKAAELLATGLKCMNKNPDVWLTLGRVRALQGDVEKARVCVKEYARLNPEGKAALMSNQELHALW